MLAEGVQALQLVGRRLRIEGLAELWQADNHELLPEVRPQDEGVDGLLSDLEVRLLLALRPRPGRVRPDVLEDL
eukprot:13568478-Alexandrium_andersonii.AAC.1